MTIGCIGDTVHRANYGFGDSGSLRPFVRKYRRRRGTLHLCPYRKSETHFAEDLNFNSPRARCEAGAAVARPSRRREGTAE